jgi:hypothetical protein
MAGLDKVLGNVYKIIFYELYAHSMFLWQYIVPKL